MIKWHNLWPKPGDYWLWIYWGCAAFALVKVGHQKWPWFTMKKETQQQVENQQD